MSAATAVAAVRQAFVVEWEEPDTAPIPEVGAEPGVDPVGEIPTRTLVSVTTSIVAAASGRRPAPEHTQDDAEQLRLAWMQGEPTF
jgi:hypothetical protein